MGIIVVQDDDNDQLQFISYNFRNFTENEQKTAKRYRENTAIVYALEMYEVLIDGLNDPITMVTNLTPIISHCKKRFHKSSFFLISDCF